MSAALVISYADQVVEVTAVDKQYVVKFSSGSRSLTVLMDEDDWVGLSNDMFDHRQGALALQLRLTLPDGRQMVKESFNSGVFVGEVQLAFDASQAIWHGRARRFEGWPEEDQEEEDESEGEDEWTREDEKEDYEKMVKEYKPPRINQYGRVYRRWVAIIGN